MPDQAKVFNMNGISSSFRQFYSQLYNLTTNNPAPPSLDSMQAYIKETDPQDSTELDKPLAVSEFMDAIKGLKLGKCPGSDWYTPRFYKTFAPY